MTEDLSDLGTRIQAASEPARQEAAHKAEQQMHNRDEASATFRKMLQEVGKLVDGIERDTGLKFTTGPNSVIPQILVPRRNVAWSESRGFAVSQTGDFWVSLNLAVGMDLLDDGTVYMGAAHYIERRGAVRPDFVWYDTQKALVGSDEQAAQRDQMLNDFKTNTRSALERYTSILEE